MIAEHYREALGRYRQVISDVMRFASERTIRNALAAVAGVFVARHLGPEGYGLLGYAGSVFELLAPLTLLGMTDVLVREFSTRGDWRPTMASALTRQLPVATAAALTGFLVIAFTRGFERDAVVLALVLSPIPIVGLHITLRSFLEATGRVRQIVIAGLGAAVVATATKLLGVATSAPVWFFGAALTIEFAILAVALAAAVPGAARLRSVFRHARKDVAKDLLRESWPLLLASIAVTVYMRADLLMLGVLSSDRETGLYSAAARLSEVWYFVPISAAAAIRPRLARLYAAGDLKHYRVSTQRFMTTAVVAAVGVAGLILVGADLVIGWLYGPSFLEAAGVLRIHIVAAPFVFLGVAGSQWFIDRGMTRAVMYRSAAGAAINVGLNIFLIPAYGALGASIATLVAYAMSHVLLNASSNSTRPIFWMQMSAFILRWHRSHQRETS